MRLRLLGNPFPRAAICTGPLPAPTPEDEGRWKESHIRSHLKRGVSLEQAVWLLRDFQVLTEEAVNIALDDAEEGEVLDIIVDGEERKIYKRKVASVKEALATNPEYEY